MGLVMSDCSKFAWPLALTRIQRIILHAVATNSRGIIVAELSALFCGSGRVAHWHMDDADGFALAGISSQFVSVHSRLGRVRESDSDLCSRPVRGGLGGPPEPASFARWYADRSDAAIFCTG